MLDAAIDPDLDAEIAQRLLERLDWVRLQPETTLNLMGKSTHLAQGLKQRYPQASHVHCSNDQQNLIPLQPKRAWFKKVEPASLLCSAYTNLPLKSQSVDMVLSNLVLHQYDWQVVLKECLRVLKPKGLLSFTLLGVDSFKEQRQAPVSPFPDLHDVGDALLQAGFYDPVMDTEKLTVTYEQGKRAVTYEIIYGLAWVPMVVTQGKPEQYIPIQSQ